MRVVTPDGSFRFMGLEPGRYIIKISPETNARVTGFYTFDGTTFQSKVAPHEADSATPESWDGYTETYYPGTTEMADALPVTLAAGDSQVVNIRMAKRRLFRASGEIKMPGMEGGIASISLESVSGGATRTTGADVPGLFTVGGLPAGQYIATATIFGQGLRTGPGGALQAKTPIMVTDHDVEGLRFAFEPELEVGGTFRMANGIAHLPAGLAVQFAFPPPGGRSDSIAAAATGEFWLSGYTGDYSIQPSVPAGYAVTEIRYGGANYLYSLVPMRGDTLDSSLTIVLTDQPGSVGGSIVDGDSKLPAGGDRTRAGTIAGELRLSGYSSSEE